MRREKQGMIHSALALCLALWFLGPSLSANAEEGTFVTFDAPGAVNGTFPFAINPAGTITGQYFDANFVAHGFVRAPDGTLTTFDAPDDVNGTFPSSINPAGVVTGYSCGANFIICPGFLRAPDGTLTTFDVPGDVCGTFPSSINPAGAVTGTWWAA